MDNQYVQDPLTEIQGSLLARGPKYTVVPRHPSKGDYIAAVEEVCHHLPLNVAVEFRADTSQLLSKTHITKPNITLQEPRAIKELKTNQSGIILTADKGVALVVMDRQHYFNKAQGLLDDKGTFRPISKDPNCQLKISLYTSSKTANHKDRSTKLHIKAFTLLVPALPNVIDYPRSINSAPP